MTDSTIMRDKRTGLEWDGPPGPDLVERLRRRAFMGMQLCDEAADRIEALMDENERLRERLKCWEPSITSTTGTSTTGTSTTGATKP